MLSLNNSNYRRTLKKSLLQKYVTDNLLFCLRLCLREGVLKHYILTKSL